MSTGLTISAIFGIIIFFICVNWINVEKHHDPATEKRLEKIKKKTFAKDNEKSGTDLKFLVQDTEYKIKLLGAILDKIKITNVIKKRLEMADLEVKVDMFILMSILLALPFVIIGILKPDNFFLFLLIGIIVALLPLIAVKTKINKRQEDFTQQFPDALGMISSSLRAGHSLPASFQIVVNEMPNPINKVFKIVVDDISLGRDTKDALNNMMTIMPGSMDLRFFVTAVIIQREIGGNLAEVLDGLGDTIRERFKLLGMLNAQTAQSKMSGVILSIAPIAIAGVLWLLNPKYMEPLFNHPYGKLSLVGAIVSTIVGFFIIMKITDIKI